MDIPDPDGATDADAIAWEQGCALDALRNQFVIPFLTRIFEIERPTRLLDVGTGTAYIPREVDKRLSYRPEWLAIDRNESRLIVGEDLKSENMNLEVRLVDINLHITVPKPVCAILMTFTALELQQLSDIIDRLSNVLHSGGLFVVAVPDVWQDVHQIEAEHPGAFATLLAGSIEISKVDKFTGKPYPFYATRIEHLIALILTRSFVLEALERGGAKGEAFVLVFRKHPASPMFQSRDGA